MRMFRGFPLLSALFCLAAMPVIAAYGLAARAVERIGVALATLFEPQRAVLDLAGFPRLDVSGGGSVGLSPALQHSLRHEAGVSRRAAARNT